MFFVCLQFLFDDFQCHFYVFRCIFKAFQYLSLRFHLFLNACCCSRFFDTCSMFVRCVSLFVQYLSMCCQCVSHVFECLLNAFQCLLYGLLFVVDTFSMLFDTSNCFNICCFIILNEFSMPWAFLRERPRATPGHQLDYSNFSLPSTPIGSPKLTP